jgi:hypothetical protein
MLNADTITDEQIRELQRSLEGRVFPAAGMAHTELSELWETCNVALYDVNSLGADARRAKARARCAEILNKWVDAYEAPREWLVCYQTAELSRWQTESAAWVAHDRAVIQGLNPDALAMVEVAARCGGCRSLATRRDADDVADVCSDCGKASDHAKKERERCEKRAAEREET